MASTHELGLVEQSIVRTDSDVGRHGSADDVSVMKISDAKAIFRDYHADFRPDIESLVHLFRATNVKAALDNSNYLHALSLTELMFQHTQKSFCMLTGAAADGFLSCLQDGFVAMLRRIKDAGGKARIILVKENGGTSTILQDLKGTFPDTLEVITVVPSEGFRMKHFIVCDDDMVRDEELHPPLTDEASANLVQAKVFFKNKTIAKAFNTKFSTFWQMIVQSQNAGHA